MEIIYDIPPGMDPSGAPGAGGALTGAGPSGWLLSPGPGRGLPWSWPGKGHETYQGGGRHPLPPG